MQHYGQLPVARQCQLGAEGGQLLLFDNAWDWRERDGEDFAVLLDICGEAAQGWTRERRPFWAVIPLAPEQLALVGREDEADA